METSLWDHILRAKKAYSRSLEPVCRRWGLTRNELDVVLFLANNPGYDRAADIVERRGIAKSHVSLSVGSLERRGFLARRFEPRDRRAAHLKLTEAALPAAAEGQQAQRDFFAGLLRGLTAEETAQWRRVLEIILHNIEGMEDQ